MNETLTQNKGGRRSIPKERRVTNVNWCARPDFIKDVEQAALSEGYANASEWVRDKLQPHVAEALARRQTKRD